MNLPRNIQAMFSIKDTDLKITYCNDVFLTYIGKKPEEAIGLGDQDFCWNQYTHIYREHELDALAGKHYSIVSPGVDYFGEESLFLQTKIQKNDDQGNISGIICQAMEVLSPSAKEFFHLLNQYNTQNKSVYLLENRNILNLTPREEEILFYLVRGKTAKNIATILCLSVRTIETYLQHVKNKLGCQNKSELIDLLLSHDFMQKIPDRINPHQCLQAFSNFN